jgi:SH3 domain-containing YSC84-like protein 1
MYRKMLVIAACLAMASPLFAQTKEDDRLEKSATVLQEILSENKGLPKNILDQASCVLIFPSVKKVAIAVGGSYGRGVLVCREGSHMSGKWGAPAMYALDQGSLGIQLGSTATDYVLVVMRQKGVDQILNGKTKIGADAAAAAGPTGAQASGYNSAAMTADVLTYSRTKGAFAGVALDGATMDTDRKANEKVYGKDIEAKTIVTGNEPVPAAAKALVDLLNKRSPARKQA